MQYAAKALSLGGQAANARDRQLQLVARAAHRIVVGAANSGRNVVYVDSAIRNEEETDAVAVLQTAPLEESGQVRRKPVKAGGRSELALRHQCFGTQFSAL